LPDRRRAQIALACACLIAAARAGAQEVCAIPADASLPPLTPIPASDALVFEVLGLVSGDAEATEITGGFSLRYRDLELTAERARIASDNSLIDAAGDVRLRSNDFSVSGENARADVDSEGVGEISFSRAELGINAINARASANDIVIGTDRVFSLNELIFTTCPEDDEDWRLLARELAVSMDEGFGVARGVRLIFKGVPILWFPYFSFPVDDRRKSGFLTPEIAERDRTGFDLTVPYYLNFAPNYDLLLEPRFMEDRGVQIGSRFRYLLPSSEGGLNFEHLNNDNSLDRDRYFANVVHESRIGASWQLVADIANVSDSAYFEDLGDSLGVISQTHLDRFIDLGYYGPRWSVLTRLQEYQTIDDLITELDRPYERRPQMLFRGQWGDRVVAFESMAEAVKFDRSIGETGWRLDSAQELSLRFARAGMYLTPALGFRQTSYRLDAVPPGLDRSPSRGLPITSLDSGLRFERDAGSDRSWIQTIEPRLLYVRIPYEDQAGLPVFDTIVPDFNLIQLFSKYQFVGGDRIADTNRVSIGLTTRLIESASGREQLSATIGQTRYREPRRVMLPNETASDSTRSNYVARLDIGLSPSWHLDVGYQWNGETEETVRAETRFEFRPRDDRLFGFGYRLREGLLEQGDLSMIWPVGQRWRVIGQYSYSLLEQKPLERFAGLEYEACCWRLRITSRRYIVRSSGQTDSTVSIQLQLKGLGQESASPEELLGRGILESRPRQGNAEPR